MITITLFTFVLSIFSLLISFKSFLASNFSGLITLVTGSCLLFGETSEKDLLFGDIVPYLGLLRGEFGVGLLVND